MKFRHFTTLKTSFDSYECCRRLDESIDPERRTLFALSGYKGSKPVIGWMDGYRFSLHKRRYYRNDYAPQCYGNFVAQDRGTLIECYFDTPRWPKMFMRIWLIFVILAGTPLFIISLSGLIKTGNYNDGSEYIGLVVPVAMALFGFFLPKFGLWVGESEEGFLLEFLKGTLIANNVEPDRNN